VVNPGGCGITRGCVALCLLPGPSVSIARVSVAVALTSFDDGGTERQMTELIRRLDPARFDVHVLCARREGRWLSLAEQSAASITELSPGPFMSRRVVRRLLYAASWLRVHRIDVVQTCDLYANIFVLPAAALARVPVRIASRRGIVSPVATPGLLPLQRAAYAAAHRIVANSEAAAARLRSEMVPADRIVVIPNGIDANLFPPSPCRRGSRIITTIANLRAGKGHDVLLRAAALLLRTHPHVRFQLVGDGPLRLALERQAGALGIADRVVMLGQRLDISRVLYESDVFALPSLMEAFPNVVMEAMASALPVVATRVGGIPELIEHGRTGLLVPAGNETALASALAHLIDNRAFAAGLGLAARASVQSHYSFEQMVRAFEQIYLEELTSRAVHRRESQTRGHETVAPGLVRPPSSRA
jgi:L-malate glycosyltransferase